MPETLKPEDSKNRLVNIRLLYEDCGEVYDSMSPVEKYGAHKLMCYLYERATGEPVPADAHLTVADKKLARRMD